METHKRTIAKTISWRILGTLITSCLIWIVTGEMKLGMTVGLIDCIIKLVTFYLHERAWSSFSFGYHRHKLRSYGDHFDSEEPSEAHDARETRQLVSSGSRNR